VLLRSLLVTVSRAKLLVEVCMRSNTSQKSESSESESLWGPRVIDNLAE
jgi:hypothetical protein